METFGIVLGSIGMLFICMAVGFVCRKADILPDGFGSTLSKLILTVTLPCSILYTMQRPFSSDLLLDCLAVMGVETLVFLFGGLVAYLVCRPLKVSVADRGVYMVSLTLPNVMFMGVPVLSSIYGSDALFYIYLAHVPFTIIAFTICQHMITAGTDVKPEPGIMPVITNPAIVTTVIGMVLFLLSLQLPDFVNGALAMLGNMTTPLAMLAIGAMIARGNYKAIFTNWRMYIFVFLRLIVIPCVVFLLFRGIVDDGEGVGVVVLLSAMPVATMTALFAERYGVNTELSSQIVCASTLFSVVTIPLMVLMVTMYA